MVFFENNILGPAAYDPVTFLGLPKAWRSDLWNWLDAYMIITGMMVLAYGTGSLSDEDRVAYTTTVLFAFAGLFVKILSYMKTINLKCRCLIRVHISARAGL